MTTIKIIIIVLFLLFSSIAWITRKLQERAAIKRARDEAMRRRLEELRTGRVQEPTPDASVFVPAGAGSPGPMSHQEATRRLQELAERRRLQLEELRRRAAGQRGPVAPPTQSMPAPQQYQPAPPAQSIGPAQPAPTQPAAPSPTVMRPTPVPKRAAPPRQPTTVRRASPRPQQGRQSRSTPAKAPPKRPVLPKQRAAEQRREAERRAKPELSVAERIARSSPPPPAPAPQRTRGKLMIPTGRAGAAEWRRIIMLRELLSPPKALREEGSDVI